MRKRPDGFHDKGDRNYMPLAKKLTFDPFAFASACLIAVFTVVSYAFQTADSFAPLIQDPRSIAIALASLVVIALVGYLALALLFSWFDSQSSPSEKEPPFRVILRKRFFVYFCIIFVCWLPWIVTNFPGTMRDDSIRQMFQVYGVEPYSGGNPLFDTWLFGLFWQLGDLLGQRSWGLYLYGVFQSLCTAASFSLMVCYLHRLRVPRPVIYLSLAALSLIIIFPLAAISMSKDSLNGWVYVVFLVLCAELCRTRGRALGSRWFVLAFIATSIVLIASKRTMLYIALIAFLVFLVSFKACRKKRALVFLTIVVASYGLTDVFLPYAMKNDVPQESSVPSAASSFLILPLQQVGRLLASGQPVDEESYSQLSRLIDCEKAAVLYNPRRGDDVGFSIRDYTDTDDRNAFLAAWAKLGMQYPNVYFEALVNHTFGWVSPFWKIAFGYNLKLDVFDESHMYIWSKYFPGGIEEAEEFLSPLKAQKPAALDAGRYYVERWATVQYETPLLIGFGPWCTWLPLVGLAYALRRRNANAVAVFAVPLGVLLSVLIGPMVLYWYAIPLYYGAPLLFSVGFMGGSHARRRRERGNRARRTGYPASSPVVGQHSSNPR